MKWLLLTLFLLTALFGTSHAQFNLKTDELNVPSSPGFVLMDKAPASIERPTTPKALSVSLLNLFQGGAVEFAPYWLKDKPTYTFEDNLKQRTPILQTLGLSVAAYKTDSSSYLSGGVRSHLFRYYSSQANDSMLRIKKALVDLLSEGNLDEAAIKAMATKLSAIKARALFNIELAGAYLGYAGPNKKLTAQRSGIWLNMRWSPFKTPMSLTALARYTHDVSQRPETGLETSYLDYGLNISYDRDQFNLALEYVYRQDLDQSLHYDRLALVANYQVAENIVVVASVGKDFTKVNNILTLIGLKFGLSREQAKL